MTPIERAARALAKQQSGTDDFDALDEGLQETLRAEVRAVIAAWRYNPSTLELIAGSMSKEMKEAAAGLLPDENGEVSHRFVKYPGVAAGALLGWASGIDAALGGAFEHPNNKFTIEGADLPSRMAAMGITRFWSEEDGCHATFAEHAGVSYPISMPVAEWLVAAP